jgi:thiol:disulfide interchange protein
MTIPSSLKKWFTLHFLIDLLFGFPLFFAPIWFLGLFGFEADVVTARLAAAALLGIGTVSLLKKEGSKESYQSLLLLKLLWSSAATIGLCLSYVQLREPILGLFILVFAGFFVVWASYYHRLRA